MATYITMPTRESQEIKNTVPIILVILMPTRIVVNERSTFPQLTLYVSGILNPALKFLGLVRRKNKYELTL